MGAYMYPININRNPRAIPYKETFELPKGHFTLDSLHKFLLDTVGPNDPFYFNEDNDSYDIITEVIVTRSRMETPEQVEARVAREEAYMEEYNRRHPKK